MRGVSATQVSPSLASLRGCTDAFRAATAPCLDDLVGRLRACPTGPTWLQRVTPAFLSATGMPGWWGKEFTAPTTSGTVTGRNLVERAGTLAPSFTMTASIGTSQVDAAPTVVATYTDDAPWPWRDVRDELRLLPDGRLLGLSFGLVPLVPASAPFLLERT